MIYPNGSIELNKLKRMVNSKDFIVYYEENTKEPIGWDWRKDGIFHGNKYPIHNENELISCISKELKNEGTICYDITKEYYRKHPCEGEEVIYVKPKFFWEWQSHNTKVDNLKITDITLSNEEGTCVKFLYRGHSCEARCYGEALDEKFKYFPTDLTVDGVVTNINNLNVNEEIEKIQPKKKKVIIVKKKSSIINGMKGE